MSSAMQWVVYTMSGQWHRTIRLLRLCVDVLCSSVKIAKSRCSNVWTPRDILQNRSTRYPSHRELFNDITKKGVDKRHNSIVDRTGRWWWGKSAAERAEGDPRSCWDVSILHIVRQLKDLQISPSSSVRVCSNWYAGRLALLEKKPLSVSRQSEERVSYWKERHETQSEQLWFIRKRVVMFRLTEKRMKMTMVMIHWPGPDVALIVLNGCW